jgi:hypothetical protein
MMQKWQARERKISLWSSKPSSQASQVSQAHL